MRVVPGISVVVFILPRNLSLPITLVARLHTTLPFDIFSQMTKLLFFFVFTIFILHL